jgi:taurine dehydrogenase small subunit
VDGFEEDTMRTLQLLTLGLLSCGAAASFAPGRAAAQARPAARAAAHGDHAMEQMLAAFADAWNRHDVDALMSMMTDDGVFESSAGNTVNGERYEGKQAVRAAYASIFVAYPDARWNNARHVVAGDRGFSEWTFTGTMKDGKRVEVTGCDLFTFRDGKIAVKNSYRKNRPPIG